MTDDVQRLIGILETEILLYEDLLDLKDREKEAVLDFSTRDLEALTEAQSELAGRAADLETERRGLVAGMVPERMTGEPTLKDVFDWVDSEEKEALEDLGATLSRVCEEVARKQNRNARIIGTSAGYLRDLVDRLIEKVQPDTVAYNLDGTKAVGRETLPSLVDRTL